MAGDVSPTQNVVIYENKPSDAGFGEHDGHICAERPAPDDGDPLVEQLGIETTTTTLKTPRRINSRDLHQCRLPITKIARDQNVAGKVAGTVSKVAGVLLLRRVEAIRSFGLR
jgi:hypothetical protein